MSDYEKAQSTDEIELAKYNAREPSPTVSSLPEYNARRASQNLMYLQYGLAGTADAQFRQPPTAYDRHGGHMNYEAGANDQPRAALEATPTAYHGFDLHTALTVLSYSPKSGTKGSLVSICFESSCELRSPTSIVAKLIFATHSVPATVTFDHLKTQEQGVCYIYMIYATAPALSEGSSSLNVPLYLQFQGQSGLDGDLINVGDWLYEDGGSFFQEVSCNRKRKMSEDLLESPRSMKRVTPSKQQTAPFQEHESYPYPIASSAYPQKHQTMDFSNMQRRPTIYGRSHFQQSLQDQSRTMRSQGLIGDASISQSLMGSPMCQTPSCNSAYEAAYQTGRTSLPSLSPSLPVSSMASPSSRNPMLIRTILIGRMKKRGDKSAGSSVNRKLNAYALSPRQAVLVIRGNLDDVQLNWSSEEFAMKRRIVRFWRDQNGTTIHTWFKSIRADEHHLPHDVNERRVSCIYWAKRNKYYITSVDIIALLELLVGIPLDFDDKGRIRRNLEKFKPCTISKTKAESQDFHKMAMGFTNPKPRNIDKDVKVFDWARLGEGLASIVSRYSENPYASSYAPGLPMAKSPSSNFSGTQSESGGTTGRYSALSSRSTSTSAASAAYRQPFCKSSTLSPPTASNGLPSYPHASPLQYLSPTPNLTHTYNTTPAFNSPYIPYPPPFQNNNITNNNNNNNNNNTSPYTTPLSTPDLSSSTYTASTLSRHRRISDALTEDTPNPNYVPLANHNHHPHNPFTTTVFPTLHPSEPTPTSATLGLPGRASRDFSAYLGSADVPISMPIMPGASLCHAQQQQQYGQRQHQHHLSSDIMNLDGDGGEALGGGMCFKEERR